MRQFLDGMGIEKTSIVGHHTGSIVATEFAASHPERVERLVLPGPLYLDEATREFLNGLKSKTEVRIRPREDGSHLVGRWNYFRNRRDLYWALY